MASKSRCPGCGGTDWIEATDNTGAKYPGCPRCIIKLPDHASPPNPVDRIKSIRSAARFALPSAASGESLFAREVLWLCEHALNLMVDTQESEPSDG